MKCKGSDLLGSRDCAIASQSHAGAFHDPIVSRNVDLVILGVLCDVEPRLTPGSLCENKGI